jgi:predicted esterase
MTCCILLLNDVFRFDIYSFGFDTEEDEKGMVDSARLINQVITSEIDSGIDANRIVLGGFSQGGTMSLMSGLTSGRNLAGLAVLSGWLPLINKFKSVCTSYQSLKLSECPYRWLLQLHTLFLYSGVMDPLILSSKQSTPKLHQISSFNN